MPFEPQAGAFLNGAIDVTPGVFEAGSPVFTPNTIIRRDSTLVIRIGWSMNGLFANAFGGSWRVRAFLESMGPGTEYSLADTPALKPLANSTAPYPALPRQYTEDIVRPANTIDAGVYKLVVSIVYVEPGGGAGPIAAFAEGPLLQVFEP